MALPMTGDRSTEFRALAAECLMLASTATDPIVRQEQLATAEMFSQLAEKYDRRAAPQDQPAAQQQQQVQPKEPDEG